jgi:hypothetical protein
VNCVLPVTALVFRELTQMATLPTLPPTNAGLTSFAARWPTEALI